MAAAVSGKSARRGGQGPSVMDVPLFPTRLWDGFWRSAALEDAGAEGELDKGTDLIQLSGMIETIDALAQGAIELPPDQRFALAQRILASMEPEEAAGIDDAWTVEIRERIRKFDSGETKGIPGAEVFAEIDRRLVL